MPPIDNRSAALRPAPDRRNPPMKILLMACLLAATGFARAERAGCAAGGGADTASMEQEVEKWSARERGYEAGMPRSPGAAPSAKAQKDLDLARARKQIAQARLLGVKARCGDDAAFEKLFVMFAGMYSYRGASNGMYLADVRSQPGQYGLWWENRTRVMDMDGHTPLAGTKPELAAMMSRKVAAHLEERCQRMEQGTP